jgi:hypothetical protein
MSEKQVQVLISSLVKNYNSLKLNHDQFFQIAENFFEEDYDCQLVDVLNDFKNEASTNYEIIALVLGQMKIILPESDLEEMVDRIHVLINKICNVGKKEGKEELGQRREDLPLPVNPCQNQMVKPRIMRNIMNWAAQTLSPAIDIWKGGAEFAISDHGGSGDCLYYSCAAASRLAFEEGYTNNWFTMVELRAAVAKYLSEMENWGKTLNQIYENVYNKITPMQAVLVTDYSTSSELKEIAIISINEFLENYNMWKQNPEVINLEPYTKNMLNSLAGLIANTSFWGSVDFDLEYIDRVMGSCSLVLKTPYTDPQGKNRLGGPFCSPKNYQNPTFFYLVRGSGIHYQLGCLRPLSIPDSEFIRVWDIRNGCDNIPHFLKNWYYLKCKSTLCECPIDEQSIPFLDPETDPIYTESLEYYTDDSVFAKYALYREVSDEEPVKQTRQDKILQLSGILTDRNVAEINQLLDDYNGDMEKIVAIYFKS